MVGHSKASHDHSDLIILAIAIYAVKSHVQWMGIRTVFCSFPGHNIVFPWSQTGVRHYMAWHVPCLVQVSAMYWDQNEHYPQFLGDHTIMVDGFQPILDRLAASLDIELNTPVCAIQQCHVVLFVFVFVFASLDCCADSAFACSAHRFCVFVLVFKVHKIDYSDSVLKVSTAGGDILSCDFVST